MQKLLSNMKINPRRKLQFWYYKMSFIQQALNKRSTMILVCSKRCSDFARTVKIHKLSGATIRKQYVFIYQIKISNSRLFS